MSDGSEHPPSFQFYPRDFVSSRSVALMSAEARGGYVMLLCHAWMSDEPGVLPDEDEALAALSGLAERWPTCRIAIRRAFAERQREGKPVLVQQRMVEERAAQRNRHEKASAGARATNEKRWGNVASESLADRSTVSPASASASASAIESKEKTARFAPPTLEAVAAYCAERRNRVDPQRFVDYYESNGWKVGKNPMRSWRAAVRSTWERGELNGNGAPAREAEAKCSICGYGPLEQEISIRRQMCGSCASDEATKGELSRLNVRS